MTNYLERDKRQREKEKRGPSSWVVLLLLQFVAWLVAPRSNSGDPIPARPRAWYCLTPTTFDSTRETGEHIRGVCRLDFQRNVSRASLRLPSAVCLCVVVCQRCRAPASVIMLLLNGDAKASFCASARRVFERFFNACRALLCSFLSAFCVVSFSFFFFCLICTCCSGFLRRRPWL